MKSTLATLMASSAFFPLYAMADVGGAGAGLDDGAPEHGLESETGFMSLAELAGADTDAIAVLTSRVPQAGLWHVRGIGVKGSQGEPKDGKPGLIRFALQVEVMGGSATDPNFDNDTMVGRKLSESYTIWPNDLAQCIGLLKGRYQKVGLPNSKMPMGGVEGQAPGWLDTMVGHEFLLQIRHGVRNGETVAYFDWKPAVPATEDADA